MTGYMAQGIAGGIESGTAKVNAYETERLRRKQVSQQMSISKDANQRANTQQDQSDMRFGQQQQALKSLQTSYAGSMIQEGTKKFLEDGNEAHLNSAFENPYVQQMMGENKVTQPNRADPKVIEQAKFQLGKSLSEHMADAGPTEENGGYAYQGVTDEEIETFLSNPLIVQDSQGQLINIGEMAIFTNSLNTMSARSRTDFDYNMAGVTNPYKQPTNKTYPQLADDWMKENPEGPVGELTKHMRAVKGDYPPSSSDSGFLEKIKTYSAMEDDKGNPLYNINEAIHMAGGGAGVVGDIVNAEITSEAKNLGNQITLSGDLGYGMSQESVRAEAAFAQTKEYDKKNTLEFRKKSSGMKGVNRGADSIINKIDDGTMDFGVTTSLTMWVKKNTPQELMEIANAYSSDTISKEQFIDRLGADAELGIIIADMTKTYFGGNASDKDRQQFIDAFGFGSWSNNETVRAKMINMKKIMGTKYKDEGESLIRAGYTASTSKEMNAVYTGNYKQTKLGEEKVVTPPPVLGSMYEGQEVVGINKTTGQFKTADGMLHEASK